MRSRLRRTLPASTISAASVRVFTTRACQSHLSTRWDFVPAGGVGVLSCPRVMQPALLLVALLPRFEIGLQRHQLGKR